MAEGGIVSNLKQQSIAILIMMSLAIIAVLAMIVTDQFATVAGGISGIGNGSVVGTPNYTVQATLTLFIAAFALFGSFASIIALVVLVKAIVGVVRGLQ